MGTRSRRRVRAGLVGLCALALAGAALPMTAVAEPSTSPSASSTGPASAGPEPGTPSPSPATSTSYSLDPDAFSVTVSPARLVVGQDDVGTTQLLTVVNRGQEAVRLDVQKRNFVTSADGGLSYRPDAPYGAAGWVTVAPHVLELDPGESQQVRATIAVPDKPDVGDHQVALIFLAPSKGDGNIRVSRGIGAPLYVTVPGPTDDSVRLDGLTGPGWSLYGRPTLTASLTSTGTVHRDFRGATALSVGTAGHLARFNDFTVTRGADRVVSTAWDPPLVCVCHPSLTVTNPGQPPQTASVRVVVLPWWLLAALLLVVAAGAVLVLRRRSRAAREEQDGPEGPDVLEPQPAGHG